MLTEKISKYIFSINIFAHVLKVSFTINVQFQSGMFVTIIISALTSYHFQTLVGLCSFLVYIVGALANI